jgi:hypothetical protein
VESLILGRPAGSLLGCKNGCIDVNAVGCVLGKLLGSLDGRLEDVILGLALGSSAGCEVGIFD